VERAIGFKLKTDALAPEGAYPIGVGDPADPNRDLLGSYIGMPSVTYNISRFRGGAAMVFEDLNPPQSIESVNRRVRQMRLQPDYEKFDWRESEVFGLTASGQAVKGSDGKDVATYRSVAIVVNDPSIACFDDEAKWRDKVAGPELKLVQAALSNERSLEKVTQFAPQVASQAAQQAAIALVLSLLAMIAYLWFRFGTMEFGLGAILALIHDVAVALGAVTLTHWIAKTPIGPLLGITEMRIDLSVVAAFLTIVGFSVNDTIVIFDRIRENRGRLGALSPQLINDAINQTFPRTLLTTIIVFLGVIVLYVQGGAGIHAFAFTMLIGCLIGNYTTMAIGVPILYRPGVMRAMLGIVVAVFAIGMVIGAESYAVRVAMIIVAVLALAALAYWQYQLRGRSAGAPATKPA
jgi:SecD/SecF fusion protein